MPAYNKTFELSIEDIETIEAALRDEVRDLSERRLHVAHNGETPAQENGWLAEIDRKLRGANDLLGRLHNQKIFYRPKAGAYIGG
ncbi:MAG: hypothetical protein JXR14_08545 [Paracoccaceae bacterium]